MYRDWPINKLLKQSLTNTYELHKWCYCFKSHLDITVKDTFTPQVCNSYECLWDFQVNMQFILVQFYVVLFYYAYHSGV